MDSLYPHAQDGNTIPTKKCSKCKRELAITTDNFRRDKKGKNGFQSRCKQCQAEYNAEHRERDSQKHREWLANHKEQQKQYGAQYYADHKEELKLSHDEWKKSHQEEIKQYTIQYRLEHHEELLERYKQYRIEHREERNKKSLERRHTEHGRLMHRTHENNRRSRKKQIPGTLTQEQIQTKLKAQRYKCYYCLNKLKKEKGEYVYHLEHTIPVSRIEHNPRHDVNYVVLACPSCNLSKNDKLPHEWLKGGRLL